MDIIFRNATKSQVLKHLHETVGKIWPAFCTFIQVVQCQKERQYEKGTKIKIIICVTNIYEPRDVTQMTLTKIKKIASVFDVGLDH